MSAERDAIDCVGAISYIKRVVDQLLQPVNRDISPQHVEDNNDNNADLLKAALCRLGVNRWVK